MSITLNDQMRYVIIGCFPLEVSNQLRTPYTVTQITGFLIFL